MVVANKLKKTDPKYSKIIFLTNCLPKLDKNKTYVLAPFQGGGGNHTHTSNNNKGRDPNKSYAEGLSNV